MEHVVVYTPLENFFYNTPFGASIVAAFFSVLVSTIVGMLIGEMLRSNPFRMGIVGKIAGWVVGILCFVSISYFVL